MRDDDIAMRRDQIASLVLAHYSQNAISRALSIPLTTVHRDVVALREEWRAHRLQAADVFVAEELQRLNVSEKAIMAAVGRGDLQAIDRLLRIQDRRAKLLGLDSPTRINIESRIRELAIQDGLDPDEAVREALRVLGDQ